MLVLDEEVALLRQQNAEAKDLLKKMEKKARTLKMLLVVGIIVMMIMYLSN